MVVVRTAEPLDRLPHAVVLAGRHVMRRHQGLGGHLALREDALDALGLLGREQGQKLHLVVQRQDRKQVGQLRHRHLAQDRAGPLFPQVRDDLPLGPRFGFHERLGRFLRIQHREHGLLLLFGKLLQGVGQVLAGQLVDLRARDAQRNAIGGRHVFQRERLHVLPGNEHVLQEVEAAQAPPPQEAVEGNIDVDQRHAALGLQQVNVVDHFGPPAVHVEDRLAHQVFVEHQPAGLVDEGRVVLAALGRLDEDRVGVDLDQAVEGNELGWLAPAVRQVQAHGLGIRFAEPHHDVRQLAQAAVDIAQAHRPAHQLRKIVEAEVFPGGQVGLRTRGWIGRRGHGGTLRLSELVSKTGSGGHLLHRQLDF